MTCCAKKMEWDDTVPVGVQATAAPAAVSKARCWRIGYFDTSPIERNKSHQEEKEEEEEEDVVLPPPPRPSSSSSVSAYEILAAAAAVDTAMRAGKEKWTPSHRTQARTSSTSLPTHDKTARVGDSNVPLLNRGTFARTTSVRSVVEHFLTTMCSSDGSSPGQVVSLGAGMDALPFELIKCGCLHANACRFIEVDTAAIVAQKRRVLTAHAARLFPGELINEEHDGILRAGDVYALAVADVMQGTHEHLRSVLSACGVKTTRPTLFILECVLVYWKPTDSDALLRFLAHEFCQHAALLVYEQVCPGDAYGEQMINNLEQRGCPLLGVCETPDALAAKLMRAGWHDAGALNMLQVWDEPKLVRAASRKRAFRLEPLDELEEWVLIQSHYALALATTRSLAPLRQQLGFHNMRA